MIGLWIVALGVARGADAGAVVASWLEAQTNLTAWSADFVQTRHLKALSQPLVSTGRVWFARPNLFRWELGIPAETIAVRNEAGLSVVYPRLKRVERYTVQGEGAGPLGEALGLFDAGFPRDRRDFEARFRLLSVESASAAWVVTLQPANSSVRRLIPRISLTLSRGDLALLANEVVFADGSRMHNEFHHSTTNPVLPVDTFRVAVGPDFTVIEEHAP